MKKALFYTFLFVFGFTAIITLLGIIKVIQIDDEYQKKLFYALLVESVAPVVALFKKTEFFTEGSDESRMNVVMLPKELFSKNGDPYSCTIDVYNKETDDERELNVSLKRENGYLCAYLDKIKDNELIRVTITSANSEDWESQFFSPYIAKAEMEKI